MYTAIDDFLRDYEQERGGTLRVFSVLSDQSLSQPVAPGFRTLGEIGLHISESIAEMAGMIGLKLAHKTPGAGEVKSSRNLADAYRNASNDLMEAVAKQYSNASLTTVDDMYGEKWPRGVTLAVLLRHEIHHRGQMTVLMRQAGLKVPGVCGPSKEEMPG